MSVYRITYRSSVKKELRKISPVMRKAITKAILLLADDPRPMGSVKIKGSDVIYRIRKGDYRVMYAVYDDVVVVEIITIGHRKDIYK